jgi:methylenetetrahydrofolate dehydrogenase (NADP+)/methenyltetrahydrofolate cyclohydrolase
MLYPKDERKTMTSPIVLDGKAYAAEINEDLKRRVALLIDKTNKTPILATILVGDDPASITYVKMKGNACKRAGIESKKVVLPESSTTQEVIQQIQRLNQDEDIHGILLQHPVPEHIDEPACFNAIAPEKDVDGVTYNSFARTAMNEMLFGSATPLGIMRLLDKYGIALEGKDAIVVGRSPILGKPMAMMLLNRNATVTICHSRTKNLDQKLLSADLVVAAVGKPKFIKSEWVKEGVILIDAGYNPGNIGDSDIEGIKEKAYAYTPVPGGVGPMTIITLIEQAISSAEMKYGL